MPERSTYRRLLAYKVYETEIERMVGEYNQSGERGDICTLDGKALLGMLKREDGTSEYALSVYDVLVGKIIAQVEVESKENEIIKAPEAIKLVKIAGKVVTETHCILKNALRKPFWTNTSGRLYECCASQTLFLRSSFRFFFSPRYPPFPDFATAMLEKRPTLLDQSSISYNSGISP